MATDRRGVLKTLTYVIGGLIGAVVAVPALGYVLFPARRKTVEGGADPIPVADLDEIPSERPIRVPVVAPAQRDAWSNVRNVPLGAVWLRRTGEKSVLALTATCPHLGCSVDFDPADGDFHCPCHTSAFDRDGNRKSGPAKRGMDPLDTVIEGGRVAVKFVRYKPDTAKREKA